MENSTSPCFAMSFCVKAFRKARDATDGVCKKRRPGASCIVGPFFKKPWEAGRPKSPPTECVRKRHNLRDEANQIQAKERQYLPPAALAKRASKTPPRVAAKHKSYHAGTAVLKQFGRQQAPRSKQQSQCRKEASSQQFRAYLHVCVRQLASRGAVADKVLVAKLTAQQ